MIFRLGRISLVAVLGGALSVFVAGIVSFGAWTYRLGETSWRQAAPLVSGWVGGFPAMLAAKESVGLADAAFAPVLITGSIFAYTWIEVAGANSQQAFHRWTKATSRDRNKEVVKAVIKESNSEVHLTVSKIAIWVATAVVEGPFVVATLLPSFPPIFTEKTIGFLLLLVLGLTLSTITSIRTFYHEDFWSSMFSRRLSTGTEVVRWCDAIDDTYCFDDWTGQGLSHSTLDIVHCQPG